MIFRLLPAETSRLRLRNRIRALHGLTGAAVDVDAEVTPLLPAGWAVAVRGSDVVVSAWDRAASPVDTPDVQLTVRDPALAVRLVAPEATVALDAASKTHHFEPKPSALEVRLRRPDGDPSSGKTVVARAGDGSDTVPLPKTADQGVYRSAEVVWAPAYRKLDVVIDGDAVRKIALDPVAPVTRVRLIDPT